MNHRIPSPSLSPLLEKSILSLIKNLSTDSHDTRHRHTMIVAGSTQKWIELSPLYEVAMRLLALFEYDKNSVDGQMLATLTKRLIKAEVAPGGPYLNSSGEVDILTNAAIAQLFTALGAPLPCLRSYLESHIRSPEALQAVNHLWVFSWPHAVATYPSDVTEYLSKSSVTTPSNTNPPEPSKHTVSANRVRHDITNLPESLRAPALTFWQGIVSADKYNEIASLSSEFTASLTQPHVNHSEQDAHLDQANFYAWMAYTIYDDFIDEEGDPAALPLANIFHRTAFDLLQSYSQLRKAKQFVTRTFDQMDEANVWEIAHCRFTVTDGMVTIQSLPRYGNRSVLARRAGAHGLGPMLILTYDSQYTFEQTRELRSYLQNYLIARQLNDDLHDWQDDLRRGHASYVVTFLLRSLHIKPGTYDLEKLIETLQTYFWKTGLDNLHEVILNHTAHALTRAKASQLFIENAPFIAMTIRPIISSVHASRAVLENKKAYLKTYTSTN